MRGHVQVSLIPLRYSLILSCRGKEIDIKLMGKFATVVLFVLVAAFSNSSAESLQRESVADGGQVVVAAAANAKALAMKETAGCPGIWPPHSPSELMA